jgi:hypothetical protein
MFPDAKLAASRHLLLTGRIDTKFGDFMMMLTNIHQ